MLGRRPTFTPTSSQRGRTAGWLSGPGIQARILYVAPALTRSMATPSARVCPRAATTAFEVFAVTTSPESGRGAHAGSGGLRSTGHTGPAVTRTVTVTLAAASAATAQLSALAKQTATHATRRQGKNLMRLMIDGGCHENVIDDGS